MCLWGVKEGFSQLFFTASSFNSILMHSDIISPFWVVRWKYWTQNSKNRFFSLKLGTQQANVVYLSSKNQRSFCGVIFCWREHISWHFSDYLVKNCYSSRKNAIKSKVKVTWCPMNRGIEVLKENYTIKWLRSKTIADFLACFLCSLSFWQGDRKIIQSPKLLIWLTSFLIQSSLRLWWSFAEKMIENKWKLLKWQPW